MAWTELDEAAKRLKLAGENERFWQHQCRVSEEGLKLAEAKLREARRARREASDGLLEFAGLERSQLC